MPGLRARGRPPRRPSASPATRAASARSRAASLIIRQPAMIGVALTTFSCGAASATLSLQHELGRLLDAEPSGGDARDPSAPARPARRGSRPRSRSGRPPCRRRRGRARSAPARGPPRTPGRRRTARPSTGMTHGEQPLAAAPADVGEVDERRAAASASARRSCACAISCCALSIRARRSSLVIGFACARIEVSAAIDGGSGPSGRSRGRRAATQRQARRRADDQRGGGGPEESTASEHGISDRSGLNAVQLHPRGTAGRRLHLGWISVHAGGPAHAAIISAMTSAPSVAGRGSAAAR